MSDYVIPEIKATEAEMISIRHYLHANPELSLEEFNTSELVASKLTEWGYQVTRGLGKTGVVGSLSKGDSPRTIGLRADMDALPIEETTGLPWASTAPGKMHACGHDGHTTILLAAAKYIASPACQFNGTVHLIFQPAEEAIGGADLMIKDGLFEQGTVAKLAMRQPFVLFKGLTFQKLCLPGAFRPGDHHNKMLRPGLCVVHASPQYL
ncbi:aminobenzoyl-glutamate utilization protein [Klebsiella pneumoniae]|nr:aminobenzoyl-glutamate utilization protein [Klebsiella pneumoniae]